MAILYLYSVVLIMLFSSVAWIFARKYDTWFDWDWLLCFLPTTIWFALVVKGIGPYNENLVIEAACITVLVPLLLTFRVFVLDKLLNTAKSSSLFIFAICVVSPVVFRFFVVSFLAS